MKVTVEELSPSKRTLHVEVPADRVAAQVESTFRTWGQTLQLPGFRRGKVPREVIQRRFHEAIREEVLRDLIPESYQQAVEESALSPVGQPAVEDIHFTEGEPLTYRAVVEVKPSVTVADYRGIALEREKVEVTDPEVDKALEYLQEDASEYVPMEGWPALREDLVILDHEGTIQGRPFKGGSGKNVTVALGHEGYLPGFTEQLSGMKKGEEKRFSLAFPADYPRKELAGRTAEFQVTVKEVKKRRLPDLNDEFAKSVGDVDTLAALREKVKEQLLQRKQRAQESELRRALMEKLVAQHPVEVPEAMAERETAAVLEEFLMTMRATGGRIEGLPDSPDALRARAAEIGRRRVQESLLLEAVARQEGLTAAPEEVEAEVRNLAAATRQEPGAADRILADPVRRAAMTGRILERKALDFLMQQATISEAFHLIQPA
jgi:trigger factor